MSHTKQRVIKLIYAMGFGDDIFTKDDTTFKNDLAFDSLDKVDLVIQCEKEFHIDVRDEDHDVITTIGNLVAYIDEKVELKK